MGSDQRCDRSVPEADGEMVCAECRTRVFSSRAAELVSEDFRCPRCRGRVRLAAVPVVQHVFCYPQVTPHRR